MVIAKRVRRCHSCGCILQDEKPGFTGYISNDILKNEAYNESILYCDNCFNKMKSLNDSQLSNIIDENILTILKDAVATDALIVVVLDAYYFCGYLPADVVKMIRKLNVIVVATHFDLFPNNYKQSSLVDYINRTFNEAGINPLKVSVIGKNENEDFKNFFDDVKLLRQGHDVYFIGSKFAGKTYLINKFLKTHTNTSSRVIRTIKYPNTNLEVLEIPFDKSSFLFELPGFPHSNSVYSRLDKDMMKYIVPNKQIKVSNILIHDNEGFAIGSLGCFLLEKGKATSFKYYSAEGTEIKRIKKGTFIQHVVHNVEKKEIRPVSEKYNDFRDFDLFDFTFENDNQYYDISILGLGWVTFKSVGQTIRICFPKGVEICYGKSKIGK